jgi:hypothetical protein
MDMKTIDQELPIQLVAQDDMWLTNNWSHVYTILRNHFFNLCFKFKIIRSRSGSHSGSRLNEQSSSWVGTYYFTL